MTRQVQTAILALLFACLASLGELRAQVKVTDNEPIKARLAGTANESHSYTIEVKDDEQLIKFEIKSKTTRLRAALFDNNGEVKLFNQKGIEHRSDRGDVVNVVLQTKLLPAKRYTLKVWAAKSGDSGPYTLTVSEPTLGGVGGKPLDPHAELKQLRKEVQELLRRLERLEKMLEEKK